MSYQRNSIFKVNNRLYVCTYLRSLTNYPHIAIHPFATFNVPNKIPRTIKGCIQQTGGGCTGPGIHRFIYFLFTFTTQLLPHPRNQFTKHYKEKALKYFKPIIFRSFIRNILSSSFYWTLNVKVSLINQAEIAQFTRLFL